MTSILATLLCAVVLQEPAAKTLDYETHAVSLRQAFKAIGDQAGLKLVASDDLAAEPIILRLKGVPVQEALDKLADVVGAEWKKRDDGSLLFVRTNAVAERLQRELIQTRADRYRRAIAEHLTRLGSLKPMTDEHARTVIEGLQRINKEGFEARGNRDKRYALHTESPSFRLMSRVMASVDPMQLAEVRAGGRRVFSTAPNAMQHELDVPSDEILAAYRQEQAAYAKAVESMVTEDPYEYFSLAAGKPVREGAVKIMCIFRREPGQETALFEARIVQGMNTLAFGSSLINMARAERMARSDATRMLRGGKQGEEKIVFSEPVEQMRAALSYSKRAFGTLGKDALERILYPEKREPLRNASSEVLFEIAAQRNANLIGYVPDSFESFCYLVTQEQSMTPSEFLGYVPYNSDFVVESNDAWMIVRAVDPIETLARRTPRTALGEFARSVLNLGGNTLEVAADFLRQTANDTEEHLASDTERLLTGETESSLLARPKDAMRFYGTLAPEQRERLAQGGSATFEFGQLSREQQNIVSRMWYDTHTEVYPTDPVEGHGTLDATEALPSGIPTDTKVVLTIKADVAVVIENFGNETARLDTYSLRNFASALALTEFPHRYPEMNRVRFGRGRLGRQREYTLEVKPSAPAVLSRYVKEVTRSKSEPQEVNALIASLSPDLRKQFDASLEDARRRYAAKGTGEYVEPPRPIPPP